MIWILLIIYQLKHFIADYLLQGKYMLGKFAKYPDFIVPLLAHVAVHGAFTFWIAIGFTGLLVLSFKLALTDMIIHFAMDRIKASPELLGRHQALSKNEMTEIIRRITEPENNLEKMLYKRDMEKVKSNTLFWWSLGVDQMVHHLTDILIIYIIIGAVQ